MEKIQTISPRLCDEENLIPFALKHQLTDKSVIEKWQICLGLVNSAFQKLTKTNSFYNNITFDNEWEDLSEQSVLTFRV